ncbi:MAG: hypothetical protein ABIJ57_03915 [Pseudomonadota bacterium]
MEIDEARIKKELLKSYTGLRGAQRVKLLPEEKDFISKREVDYKRWLPKILRDLFFHDANIKETP